MDRTTGKTWRWLYWGVEHAATVSDRRKVLTTNICALIALVGAPAFALGYFLLDGGAMQRSGTLMMAFVLPFALVPWLNRGGLHRLASLMLCVLLMAITATLVGLEQGTYLNEHWYLLVYAAVVVVVFPVNAWRYLVPLFVLNVGAFLLLEIMDFAPEPALYGMAAGDLNFWRILHPVSAVLVLLALLCVSEYVATVSENDLERLSTTDGLTGIANRRHLMNRLSHEWSRGARTEAPLAVALLDVDHFKRFNDHYGHQAGDKCLKQVAQTLKVGLRRDTDVVARYGGEEFVVVMPATSLAEATANAERVCQAVRALGLPHERSDSGRVTISIGVAAAVPGRDGGFQALLQQADEALYRAKGLGRDRVVTTEA